MSALVPMQVDVGQTFEDAVQAIIDFIPRLLLFLLILVIGWIIARLLRTIVRKVLQRLRFDQAVQRGGLGRALENTRYDASGLLAEIVYYALLLIVLWIAFGVFGDNPISDLLDSIISWLPQLFVAIIIIVIAAAIARVVRDLLGGVLSGLSYGPMLANITSWFIIALGVIAALNQVGVATTVTTPILIAALAAVVGVIVVGVGGGLVRPMQARWERWLDRAAAERPTGRAPTEPSEDQATRPIDTSTETGSAYPGPAGGSRRDRPDPGGDVMP